MKNLVDLLSERGLPSNLEAERLVLGSILLNDTVYVHVGEVLDPEDFSLEKHRRIFSNMRALHIRGERIDRITVANELLKNDQLESVDGLSYLNSLDDGLPHVAHLDSYVKIVRDKSTLRRAIHEHWLAIQDCLAAADPTPEILERAERAIATLAAETRAITIRTPKEVVDRSGGINEFLNPTKRQGIATPWRLLNGMLAGHGFTPSQMVVIGARPSMGKTALACQIADYAATHGTGVAVFTLEMPDDAILLRMACARAEVDSLKVSQRGIAATKH
jgi:replicative DNA helicase